MKSDRRRGTSRGSPARSRIARAATLAASLGVAVLLLVKVLPV